MRSIYVYIVLMLCLSSCAHLENEQDLIGVYKVVDTECVGSVVDIEACNSIVFIEFVKGKFYGVSDDEVAFVVWSGSYDLTYAARKLDVSSVVSGYPFSVIIDDSDYIEKLNFESYAAGEYIFGSDSIGMSKLKIKRASVVDVNKYIKVYPDRD